MSEQCAAVVCVVAYVADAPFAAADAPFAAADLPFVDVGGHFAVIAGEAGVYFAANDECSAVPGGGFADFDV